MKNTFRRFAILILLFSSLLIKCKDDDDPVLPVCKLIAFESPTVRFDYNYEGDILRSRTTTSVASGAVIKTVTYEYDDAGNLVSLSAPGEIEKLTYTSGQITKKEFIDETRFSDTDYEYLGQRLVKIQYYRSSTFDKSNHTKLEYSGSNVVVARTFSKNGDLVKVEAFEHGENYSPFLATPEAYQKLLKLEDFSVGNCLTSYENTEGVEIAYVSEFNSYGFPTRITATFSDGRVDHRTFTYSCPD